MSYQKIAPIFRIICILFGLIGFALSIHGLFFTNPDASPEKNAAVLTKSIAETLGSISSDISLINNTDRNLVISSSVRSLPKNYPFYLMEISGKIISSNTESIPENITFDISSSDGRFQFHQIITTGEGGIEDTKKNKQNRYYVVRIPDSMFFLVNRTSRHEMPFNETIPFFYPILLIFSLGIFTVPFYQMTREHRTIQSALGPLARSVTDPATLETFIQPTPFDSPLMESLKTAFASVKNRLSFFDTIINTIPSAVIVTDPDGRILQTNRTALMILSSDSQMVGKSIYLFLSPVFHSTTINTVIRSAIENGGNALYWEARCDNTIFPVFLQIQAISLAGEKFILFVTSDMSDVKNANDELFFRSALLDSVFDSVIAYHIGGKIVYANHAAALLHRYSIQEITIRNADNLIFPTSLVEYREKISSLTSLKTAVFQIWHLRKDGTYVFVDTHASLVTVNGRDLIIETHHDLTQTKANENALKESEERFRSFFDNAKDCVFIATNNGYLMNINNSGRAFLDIRDIDPREIDLFSLFKDDEQKIQFIKTIQSFGFVRDFKAELKRLNGSVSSVEINASFFHNPLYHFTGYHGFIRDVTGELLMEAQVRQSQKLDAIGRLAGGIAHDFNNILTVIIGNTELGLLSLGNNHPLIEPLNEIKDSAQRAAKLTSQLLAFSRKQMLQVEPINANSLINNLYKMLKRLIGETINLTLKTDSNIMAIRADSNQFEQIILNLALNARDAISEHTESKEKSITIETSQIYLDSSFVEQHIGMEEGPYLHISVTDTGSGIKPDYIDKIFDPFFTTKAPDKGTGLGLSTVFGIISQNKAYIFVDSKEGEFSRFDIYWPSIGDSFAPPKSVSKESSISTGTESILVVEDEVSLCAFAANALTQLGYQITSANSYDDAIDMYKKSDSIALAFIDIVIPGKNGIQLAQELVKLNPDLRILFTSGYPDSFFSGAEELLVHAEYIEKPYNISELANIIRSMLDNE